MAPRTKPEPAKLRVHPDDEVELAEATAQAERGELTELSPEELRRWVETGEWPESSD